MINPTRSNDDGQNWGASLTGQGTPGAVNSIYDIDTAPIIRRVVHSPAIPNSADEAAVRAEMADHEGTQVRYNVGVRNRGNRSRFDPPMNYHVSFRHDRPWQDNYGLNLNSKYTHCQVIASAFYRLAGLAASTTTAVQLRVNGVNPAAADRQ